MEQKNKQEVVYDGLPPLSSKYPWFVVQTPEWYVVQSPEAGEEEAVEEEAGQFFYTLKDEPRYHYRCQIPELLGRRIRGCFHGWVILSNHPQNVMWFLWNPVTSNIIRLPPLILKDGNFESIQQCCLSFPPDDPNSVLMLTRDDQSTFVFCRLHHKKKRLTWSEMSFSKQLTEISGDGRLLSNLTCCYGKVYALNTDGRYDKYVIQVDIVVKKSKVEIHLYLFGVLPFCINLGYCEGMCFLKGSSTELFCIIVYFTDIVYCSPSLVTLFKLDMTSLDWEKMEDLKNIDVTRVIVEQLQPRYLNNLFATSDTVEDSKIMTMTNKKWEEIVDLKDAMFYVDLAHDYSIAYNPSIASELGGYIHMRSITGTVIHSYDLKHKTISLYSMPSSVLPTSHVYMWECNRFEDDLVPPELMVDPEQLKADIVSVVDGFNEPFILNLPFDILEMIMKLCVGVDYMNFRATCKQCHLAAPETPLRRLEMYSHWLMVLDKDRHIITLTNPMLGDKYFIKNVPVSYISNRLCCSRFGWLLFYTDLGRLVFYNPFTSEIRQLPHLRFTLRNLCFSAPPTSPDCMVFGISDTSIYIHFIARKASWRRLKDFDVGYHCVQFLSFSTFHGRDIYTFCNLGNLWVIKDLGRGEKFAVKTPRRCTSLYFSTKCDLHLLLVIVEKTGESVEVFKFNDFSREWEIIDDIGTHMIYICGSTSICIEAKSREMENKIYFPRFHCNNERMVFYSLETKMFHTFNGKNIGETFGDFVGTRYHDIHLDAWIEPTWS